MAWPDRRRLYICQCATVRTGVLELSTNKGSQGEWVIVGYDKRFQSENFAVAVAEVLAANGFGVYLTDGATPTPVIAYAVVNKHAVGAVNITASHNPATDNGFKVRNEFGGAIDPDGLNEIESRIPDSEDQVKRLGFSEGLSSGKIVMFDAAPEYIKHLGDLIDVEPIRRAGLNILVDPMWGNGSGMVPQAAGRRSDTCQRDPQRA